MPIITVRDNEKSRRKRNAKKTTTTTTTNKKRQKKARGTEDTEKGRELNDFIVHLS